MSGLRRLHHLITQTVNKNIIPAPVSFTSSSLLCPLSSSTTSGLTVVSQCCKLGAALAGGVRQDTMQRHVKRFCGQIWQHTVEMCSVQMSISSVALGLKSLLPLEGDIWLLCHILCGF